MALTFHTMNTETGSLVPSGETVAHYPGGDPRLPVDRIDKPTGRPVAWNTGGALDYQSLAMWVNAHRDDQRPILVSPRLPSARGDHDRTDDARAAARLTAATGIRDVFTVDPHSDVWADEAAHNGLTVHAVGSADLWGGLAKTFDGIISPDKGGVARAETVAAVAGVPLYRAGKTRDSATGALSGFVAPPDLPLTGLFLIVDDICDGGGTFAGLASAIAQRDGDLTTLSLAVAHGVFSGKAEQNLGGFDTVYAGLAQPFPVIPSERADVDEGSILPTHFYLSVTRRVTMMHQGRLDLPDTYRRTWVRTVMLGDPILHLIRADLG